MGTFYDTIKTTNLTHAVIWQFHLCRMFACAQRISIRTGKGLKSSPTLQIIGKNRIGFILTNKVTRLFRGKINQLLPSLIE